jgi:hypothetical protein
MRQEHAGVVAQRFIVVEGEDLAGNEVDLALGELADAQLWSLQIGENADRAAHFLFDIAQAAHEFAHEIMAGMAHVDAEHVGTGFEQFANHRFVG